MVFIQRTISRSIVVHMTVSRSVTVWRFRRAYPLRDAAAQPRLVRQAHFVGLHPPSHLLYLRQPSTEKNSVVIGVMPQQ